MSDYIPSKLENLPNEILIEIFDYIQINHLIYAFLNLNHRFNSILFSLNIHLRVLYPDDLIQNNIEQSHSVNLLINPKCISRLHLTNDKNIPNEQIINYSNIRSLLCDTPTTKIIEFLTPERFPRLEYLRIGYYKSKNGQINQLHQSIFSNKFPFLRKCSLNNINDNEIWTGSPSIHLLGIWCDNPRTVVQRILYALQNLRYLELYLTWPSTFPILDEKIINQHMNLNSLKLHLCAQWTLEKLDSFLAYIPKVKYLYLLSSYFDAHMNCFQWDFKVLANILLCRLPNLSRFNCEFIFKRLKSSDLDSISSLHSCFDRIKYETYFEDDLFIRVFTEK